MTPNPYLLTRRCPRCREHKPEDAFSYRNKARLWLSSYCRPCLAVAQRASRDRVRPPAIRALVEAWRKQEATDV